jgi:hypothetical protein
MDAFIAIVLLIFGVLQIILFFKIWGMTNRVSSIDDKLVSSIDEKLKSEKGYYFYMLSGEKEKAFIYLKEKIISRFLELLNDGYMKYRFIELANRELKDYLKLVEQTGFELPDHLKSGEAFFEYYNKIKGQ